jgi:hypothetical protein
VSGVGYETNPELIKEFDQRALFRRYRIVFWACSAGLPATVPARSARCSVLFRPTFRPEFRPVFRRASGCCSDG